MSHALRESFLVPQLFNEAEVLIDFLRKNNFLRSYFCGDVHVIRFADMSNELRYRDDVCFFGITTWVNSDCNLWKKNLSSVARYSACC